MLETIKELSLLNGVSGDESAVRDAIISKIEGHCTYSVDALGNLICYKTGKQRAGKRLQLSAHMDEVGFIITCIEEDGTLRFAAVGGVDARVAAGRQVRVGTACVPGVIGLKPIHLLEGDEKDAIPKLEDLVIDIGADGREQAQALAAPGDRAVFVGTFTELGGNKLLCKALDDRAGCALLIRLIQSELPYDCAFTFTVQEETGCTGGKTAAFAVDPEIALAIETTTAGDIADAPAHKRVCALGAGPVVSFMDRGTLYDRELYRRALDVAREKGIRCQSKNGVFGGNESRSLQTARAGARVLAVSLPCRYLHSASCMLDAGDLEETEKLLAALISAFAVL